MEQINGVYYHWRVSEFPENNFVNTKQIGVIAQELEQVYPELVITGSDGYKTVDYPKLTAVLLEAVKNLSAKNEQQQNEITELQLLKSEVEALKVMLAGGE